MSLTIFYGLLTLVPLALAVILAALGFARRAAPAAGVALAALGVLLPLIGLAWLAAEVSAGFPLEIGLWGGATSWVAIYARADALAAYTGLGVAGLVTPLLLWVAWRAAPPDIPSSAPGSALAAPAEDGVAEEPVDTTGAVVESEIVAGEAAGEAGPAEEPVALTASGGGPAAARAMSRWQWTGVALVLALESLLLSLVFAENIVWLAICWLLVIGVSWGLGELGSDTQSLDWKGLALMATPVLVWFTATILVAISQHAPRLLDLTGAEKYPISNLFFMTLAVALAAGAWPALGWVRKRANITAPAGLGAAALAAMPAAIFVGARTFSLAQKVNSQWPEFAIGKPPITIGALFVLLGALTVLIAGLLALGRRDGRGLFASAALATAGWGLIGLGVGAPLAALGVTLLLATGTLGLGAMLASLVASGAVTADLEPDSAGPRVFGEPARPAALAAWVIGGASVIGLPFFAGFTPLEVISAASLPGPRVVIPLIGLAWVGAALLLIGLLRATAPAWSAPASQAELASPEKGGADLRAVDLPAVALAALVVIAGLAPATLLLIGSIPAAGAFLQVSALQGVTDAQVAGYSAGVAQWLSTPAALALALAALLLAVLRLQRPRGLRAVPLFLSGQPAGSAVESDDIEELAGMPEPEDAWDDLIPVVRSGWLTPAGGWLGVTEENGEALALAGEPTDALEAQVEREAAAEGAEPTAVVVDENGAPAEPATLRPLAASTSSTSSRSSEPEPAAEPEPEEPASTPSAEPIATPEAPEAVEAAPEAETETEPAGTTGTAQPAAEADQTAEEVALAEPVTPPGAPPDAPPEGVAASAAPGAAVGAAGAAVVAEEALAATHDAVVEPATPAPAADAIGPASEAASEKMVAEGAPVPPAEVELAPAVPAQETAPVEAASAEEMVAEGAPVTSIEQPDEVALAGAETATPAAPQTAAPVDKSAPAEEMVAEGAPVTPGVEETPAAAVDDIPGAAVAPAEAAPAPAPSTSGSSAPPAELAAEPESEEGEKSASAPTQRVIQEQQGQKPHGGRQGQHGQHGRHGQKSRGGKRGKH